LIWAVVKNRKKFEALRNITLESGQEEIERRDRRRKEAAAGEVPEAGSTRSSLDSLRSPTTSHARAPTLGDVPEDETFAIGDDDDDDDSDDEHRATPSQSTPSEQASRASSVASVEDAVPTQVRGMSEKARGKMPAGSHSFSRQNSTTSLGGQSASASQSGLFEPSASWIDSWLPELPLHTILTAIQQLTALIPRQELIADVPARETLGRIQEVQLVGVEPSPIRVHSFEWSPLALGWYESLIWSFIFASELHVSKGAVGIWNATNIKLFRVQETAAVGPSLTSPRGAVDAVGSNIVSRIGAIDLRGAATRLAPGAAAAAAYAGGVGAGAATQHEHQQQQRPLMGGGGGEAGRQSGDSSAGRSMGRPS